MSSSEEIDQLQKRLAQLEAGVAQGFAQVSQRLDADLGSVGHHLRALSDGFAQTFSQLSGQLGQRLEQDLGILARQVAALAEQLSAWGAQPTSGGEARIAALSGDLSRDLAGLSAQLSERLQQDLGALARQVEALAEKLPAETAGAAPGAHGGGDETRLVALLRDLSQEVARLPGQLGERLGQDLGALARQVEALAEKLPVATAATSRAHGADDEAGTAALSRDLSRSVGELAAQIGQRLDGSLGDVAAQIGQLAQRLDDDVRILAGQIGQLSATSAASGAQAAAEFASGLGQVNERISNEVASFAAVFDRLDRNVGEGLSQFGERLDGDLGRLSSTLQQNTDAIRHNSALVARLVLDTSLLADRLRGQRPTVRAPSIAPAAIPQNLEAGEILVPWRDADLPPEIMARARAAGFGSEQGTWCLAGPSLPQGEEQLVRLLDIMASCRARLKPGERVVWAAPVGDPPLLEREETEQILGLLGPIVRIADVDGPGGAWRLAEAQVRIETFSVAIRWSIGALDELHLRSAPMFAEARSRFGLAGSLHGIELPGPDFDFAYWTELVASLMPILRNGADRAIGIVLAPELETRGPSDEKAISHLREELARFGETIAFQWVRGSVRLDESDAITGVARRHGIPVDCSAVARGSHESRLAAFDDLVPYRPLRFDLRLPSFAIAREDPVEIARWSGRDFAMAAGNAGAPPTLEALFDADFERDRRRLGVVLDRAARREFERQSNFDPALTGLWADNFVYNWPAPPPGRIRLIEFDAIELMSEDAPLWRLYRRGALSTDTPRFLGGRRFLQAARTLADEAAECDPDLLDAQIEGHRYLHDRVDITADAARLIEWMPQDLGQALELGSGYGVMARRVRERASSYVGLDLTTDQASALNRLGGMGLVADIHALPFPDESFDTIIADNVVEHAYDPIAVLAECRRVLRPGGAAYLVIPPDYLNPAFRNRTHLWKSDESSVRHAVERAGLRVLRQETVHMPELGVTGAHPSSNGMTGLWYLARTADAGARALDRESHR